MDSLWNWMFPSPQWYLTQHSEDVLKNTIPAKWYDIKSTYDTAVANTNAAYSSVIPNTINQTLGIGTMVIIGAIVIVVLILAVRK